MHMCQKAGICTRIASHTSQRVSKCSTFIIYLLIIILMEFCKVWTKHNFYYIRYISVSIQLRYVYLIVRSVNANNMNLVILRSLWILASRGKNTSVWSTDTGDTSERIAELCEMSESFSIILHSETPKSPAVWACLSENHPEPLIGRAKENALNNPPCPITPTLTSSSVHHSSHQLTTTFLSY